MMGNIMNGIVWSRKNMLTSTNYILTALAIADGISLFMYFLYAVYFFIATEPREGYFHSEAGMYLVLIAFHQFLAFHTLANWLTISLAIFRYMKVCRPNIAKKYCNIQRAKLTILITAIITAFAAIPFYFFYEVYDLSSENNPMYAGFWLRKTNFAENHKDYQLTLLWLYGVIFKVLPSMGMIVLSVLMILKLREAKRRHDDLQSGTSKMTSGYTRTTVMLLIIVLIYVITELPIGITSFFSGLEATESHFFYFLLYSYVGDLIDLLACANGTINFFVYYTISRQFRTTFRKVFFSRFFRKYATAGQSEIVHSDTTDHNELSSTVTHKISLKSVLRKKLSAKPTRSNISDASAVS
ncbi:hypothetical protein FSP39_025377 [Pinctada imbricata]|uniref:G-protein coupled receptors family 1 profile domain-containing protein n=1 Tax=Pinctada imbricata TaxID=66713 RepID=A0AA89BY33_PINIB|nr:hypothetical protein FSP39_025377 [Pinctada imbricata]